MNRATTNPPPGDELDALLRAYFQTELPTPWPAFRPPAEQRSIPFRKRGWSGRAALLAASVMLLAAAALMPKSRTTAPERAGSLPTLGPANASPSKLPPGPGSDRPGRLTPDKPDPTGFKMLIE